VSMDKGKGITIANTRKPPSGWPQWRRLNITKKHPEGKPFSRTVIWWELKALRDLGFLEARTVLASGGFAETASEYFFTEKFLKATADQIDRICSIGKLGLSSSRLANPRRNHAAFQKILSEIEEILGSSQELGDISSSPAKVLVAGCTFFLLRCSYPPPLYR